MRIQHTQALEVHIGLLAFADGLKAMLNDSLEHFRALLWQQLPGYLVNMSFF